MQSQLLTLRYFILQGNKVIRIDGTISSTAERQHLINTFQTLSSLEEFLDPYTLYIKERQFHRAEREICEEAQCYKNKKSTTQEIKQFVVVTEDPEFCLGTTLLYIDTRNNHQLTYCLALFFVELYMCRTKNQFGSIQIIKFGS